MEQTADAKDVLGRRSLNRKGKKEGRPEVEKGKPLMVEGKRHLVVEECSPEEEEQGPE